MVNRKIKQPKASIKVTEDYQDSPYYVPEKADFQGQISVKGLEDEDTPSKSKESHLTMTD